MKELKVALLSQDLAQGGGVAALNRFVYSYLTSNSHALAKHVRFVPQFFAYAPFKFHPEASVSLFNAFNRGRGVGKAIRTHDGIEQQLIGAYFPELEVRRYYSNAVWREALSGFDIYFFVTGVGMLGYPLAREQKKFVAWIASTLYDERMRQHGRLSPVRRLYELWMMAQCEALESETVHKASHLCALSTYTEKILLERYPSLTVKPRSILAAPTDTARYTPLLTSPPERGYILTVGRINDERKNLPMLLDAYCAAAQRSPSLPPLYIAGEAPKPAFIEQVKRLGIESRVKFLGAVKYDDLPSLYRRASLFVLSSLQEGLGIVILEAMASGVPVIATRCGGPEMMIADGENGLLTENGNAAALAEKMVQVTDDIALRRKFIATGRETVEKLYSVEAIGSRMLEVFRRTYPEHF